jgi:HD-GYP domain-containing protein (c-di-GMP phosphodiesterase class II)
MIMNHLIGKKVMQDVMNARGVVIIPAKKVIREQHLELCKLHNVDFFSIMLESDNGSVNDPASVLAEQIMEQSLFQFQSIRLNRKVPVLEFKNTILPVIDQIAEDPNLFRLLKAVKAKDEYTHCHNIGVSVIATLIGKWLNMEKMTLTALSLAALLHDIGNVRIPVELLNKEDSFREDEYEFFKQHTIYGYEMLKDTIGISNRVALTALQHHEREDGSGYPLGLKKDQIEPFSKIVAVADIFHAMYSKRSYQEPFSLSEIINELKIESFGKLDPHIVSVFTRNITNKWIGRQVLLSNGQKGNIVYMNPYEETKPLILMNNNHFIDLGQQRMLQINEIVS